MAPTKLEINLRRLLERCEAMASEYQDNKENISWRLDKVNPVNLFKFFPSLKISGVRHVR